MSSPWQTPLTEGLARRSLVTVDEEGGFKGAYMPRAIMKRRLAFLRHVRA
jgi:hypothetical protein